jgi:hypothetical protein
VLKSPPACSCKTLGTIRKDFEQMTDRGKVILRWVFFIPLSILASEIVKYLLNLMGGGTLELFFPLVGQTISGIITWVASAVVLIYTAHLIIPAHK